MVRPDRILILGASGAGKSTLARCVGNSLGIAVIHLDALFWRPGWVQTDAESFREKVVAAAAGDAWVMDGNYSATLDIRLPRAQAVIWLDLPRTIYFSRAVWRSIKNHGCERGDVGPGNPERFDLSFFKDWVWTYPHRGRDRHAALLENLPPGVRGIVLRSRAEVATFAAALPGSLNA